MQHKVCFFAQLADHLNAEIVAGTVRSKQDAVDYLTWTFFFRRLLQNPSYYDLPSTEADDISVYLSRMVESALISLEVRQHGWSFSQAFLRLLTLNPKP